MGKKGSNREEAPAAGRRGGRSRDEATQRRRRRSTNQSIIVSTFGAIGREEDGAIDAERPNDGNKGRRRQSSSSASAAANLGSSAVGLNSRRRPSPHGLNGHFFGLVPLPTVLLLLFLLISSTTNLASVSAQKAGENVLQSQLSSYPQIGSSIDAIGPAAVDGSTDNNNNDGAEEEEYYFNGQWDGKAAVDGATAVLKGRPMQFIRKFSWDKRNDPMEQQWMRGQRRKRPAENEYAEMLAARLAVEEDVDRLGTAEGGDRLAYFDELGDGISSSSTLKPMANGRKQTSRIMAYSSASPPPSSSRMATTTMTTKFRPPPNSAWQKLSAAVPSQVKQSERTFALSQMDLKSDGDLAKMMERTTMRTRAYPTERTNPFTTTTPFPLLGLPTSPAPSLLTLPGLLFPHGPPAAVNFPPPSTGLVQYNPQQQQQGNNRRALKAEQFEQLGCGFDFMSQTCKDVFRFGWCQNCVDFGHAFLHDCRCVAVTGLYVQTATFLGSSTASARANAAATAVQSNHSTNPLGAPLLPVFPSFLPTLEQLAVPLDGSGHSAPSSTSSPSFLAQTVTPASRVVQALADAFRLPPGTIPPLNLLGTAPSAVEQSPQSQQQQQQQQPVPLAFAPLLGPPARAFGSVQFVPSAPIVPQYVSVSSSSGRNGNSGKKK